MSRKYETRGQKKKADPPAPEETKQSKKGGKSVDSSLKTSIKTEETSQNTPLLAWCSHKQNMINISEILTRKNYATFSGARLSDIEHTWTHVKEIPNTKLLVSLHHNREKSANLEIYDISNKAHIRKIYSLGEVSGKTADGDVTYNSRRGILGAIPIDQRTSYHLFQAGNDTNVKLLRKTKWHSQQTTWISSVDFDPAGEVAATIDIKNVCLISDVNTNRYGFHLTFEKYGDSLNRCRWSTNIGEPLLYIKYEQVKLNILDVEKKALVLRSPIDIEEDRSCSYWIDVCPTDGNLLVEGGQDSDVKVIDKREAKIVKSYDIHDDHIRCVKWSSTGNTIASVSWDGTAKLLDFKTGKVRYTEKIPEGYNAYSVCFL